MCRKDISNKGPLACPRSKQYNLLLNLLYCTSIRQTNVEFDISQLHVCTLLATQQKMKVIIALLMRVMLMFSTTEMKDQQTQFPAMDITACPP